jgi:hypothetical protein
VDGFQYTPAMATRMGMLGADADGQVYVGGAAVGADGATHWLVRRGTGTGTWTTIDDYQLAPGASARLISFGGRDGMFAAGTAADAAGAAHWIIRRLSMRTAGTFTTLVDAPPTQAMEQLEAHSVYQTPAGALFAVGRTAVGTTPGRVMYRRSDDGQGWTAMGTFMYVAGQDTAPAGRIVGDAAGNLFSMARGVDAAGSAHWLVRKLTCN